MMRTILYFLLFLFAHSALNAQILPDQVWVTGTQGASDEPGYGNAIIRFTDGQVDIVQAELNMNFESTMAVMPDSLGNILFYTNGCFIANRLGNPMLNGTGLNSGEMHDWTCPEAGYVSPMGAMILAVPGSDHLYYLFHMGVRYEAEILCYGPFYYSVVDMSLDGGLGAVVEKNVVVAEGNFEPFSAVRHGNGRDWWLCFPGYGTNQYYKFLLGPNGLTNMGVQQTGPEMGCRYIGSSAFAPTGARYARQQHCGVVVMNFNRCSGELSQEHFLPLPPNAFGGGGVAFSPDGNRLLVSTQLSVQEALLDTPDPVLDTIVDVLQVIGSSLHLMQYTPEGNILLSNLGRGKFYHLIENPEGPDPEFLQRGFALPVFSIRTLPNYPNYRLYDLADSPCDTLGIDAVATYSPTAQQSIHIAPNPVSADALISVPSYCQGVWRLHDLSGITRLEGIWEGPSLTLSMKTLPPGLYFFQLRKNEGDLLQAKIIVAH